MCCKCDDITISYEAELDEINRDLMELAEDNSWLKKINAELLEACKRVDTPDIEQQDCAVRDLLIIIEKVGAKV